MNITAISVGKAKSHISEIIAKSQFLHQRFIITKRDKPVAALVSIEDLNLLEQIEEKQGLASIAGKWEDFDDLTDAIGDLKQLRKNGGMPRNVSL